MILCFLYITTQKQKMSMGKYYVKYSNLSKFKTYLTTAIYIVVVFVVWSMPTLIWGTAQAKYSVIARNFVMEKSPRPQLFLFIALNVLVLAGGFDRNLSWHGCLFIKATVQILVKETDPMQG